MQFHSSKLYAIFIYMLALPQTNAFFSMPVIAGPYALQGLARLAIASIETAVYMLSNVHTGHKRFTRHSKPEFEQTVEVLDFPEDMHQQKRRENRQRQNLAGRDGRRPRTRRIGAARHAFKSKTAPLRRAGKARVSKDHPASPVPQPKSDLGNRSKGLLSWLPWPRLQRKVPCNSSRAARRRCRRIEAAKPVHVDSLSGLYPSYRPWKEASTNIGQLIG